jgi:hypothetical protein
MRSHFRRSQILTYLASQSLSIAEYNVIHLIHYASYPPVDCVRMAQAESLAGHRVWPASSRSACRDAVASLMLRGVLQLIDANALRRIEAEMVAEPAFGPLSGLPELGDIDFTREGGALWRRIDRELFECDEADFWTGLGEEDSMTFYATSEATLRRQLVDESRFSGREILSVSEIAAIGPWRDRWWDPIMERGYRATVTYGAMLDEE